MIDLEAIRAKMNRLCGMDSFADVESFHADVDAILAEVERLREILRMLFPDAVERAYVTASPETVTRYLAARTKEPK